MPSNRSRRTLVAGALGGLGGFGALATGGYAWNRYATRDYLRFRPLEAVNESNEPFSIAVTVRSDRRGKDERTVHLEATGDEGDASRLNGPWIESPRAYSVRVTTDGEELVLGNRELVERLEGANRGSDCAHVTVVVAEDSRLEAEVSPSDEC